MKFINALLLMFLFEVAGFSSGAEEGRSLAKTASSYFKNNMNTAINKPMTANSQMQTVDGSSTFSNTNLNCSQTSITPFFRMDSTVTNGGEISLNTFIDQDLDGAFETNGIVWTSSGSQIASRGISGVCFNGVVSCNAGTWTSCKYFRWVWSGSALILAEADYRDVMGCQCTNNSCGGNAYTQPANLVDILSSGANEKITQNNTKLTITKVDKSLNSITYWGQDYSNCNNNGISQDKYSGSLENKGAMAQQEASLDPNSAAYTMMNSQSAQETSTTQRLNYFSNNNFGSSMIDENTSSKIMTRQQSISQSVEGEKNSNGFTFGYSDTYVDKEGNVIQESRGATVQMDDTKMIKLCTVYWYEQTPDVYADGTNRSISNVNDEVKKMEVRECVNDQCPVNAGEGIDKNCAEGSQKDLMGVAARLQGIQEAANDMICSSK